MIIELFHLFDKVYLLSDNCKYRLKCRFKEHILLTGERILKPGNICNDLAFVHTGMLRGYVRHNGKEITTRFGVPGDLCFDPKSYFFQTASPESIRAVRESLVYSLTRADVETIYQEFPEFRNLTDIYFRLGYVMAEEWLYAFRAGKPRERFDWANQRFPHLLNDAGNLLSSTYFGFAADTISRFKKSDVPRSSLNHIFNDRTN